MYRLIRFSRKSEGSFTLEASFVFPLLISMVLLVIFVALYVYEQGIYYYGALRSSEAAAFHWDNSKRSASGLPPAGESDGLYWRLTDDGLLMGFLHMGAPAERISSYSFPAQEEKDGDLAAVKLAKAGERIGGSVHGELEYRRSALHGEIITRLYPSLNTVLPGDRKIGAAARAELEDPVEFIRTVDLVRYYSAKFLSSKDTGPDEAGKVLQSYASSH